MDDAQVKIEELANVLDKLLTTLGKDVAERYSLAGDSTSSPSYFVTALAWLILDESAAQLDNTVADVVLTCARLRAVTRHSDEFMKGGSE